MSISIFITSTAAVLTFSTYLPPQLLLPRHFPEFSRQKHALQPPESGTATCIPTVPLLPPTFPDPWRESHPTRPCPVLFSHFPSREAHAFTHCDLYANPCKSVPSTFLPVYWPPRLVSNALVFDRRVHLRAGFTPSTMCLCGICTKRVC